MGHFWRNSRFSQTFCGLIPHCKSVVYDFGGSNPPPPTSCEKRSVWSAFLLLCGGFARKSSCFAFWTLTAQDAVSRSYSWEIGANKGKIKGKKEGLSALLICQFISSTSLIFYIDVRINLSNPYRLMAKDRLHGTQFCAAAD